MSLESDFEQPFPGLRPYEMKDSPLFFGRHTHVAEMISLLERQRFLAVVGASGSGKSSLVRAGLLPAIRDGYVAVDQDAEVDVWKIVITRPGDDPYRALADSLVRLVSVEPLDDISLQERVSQCEAVLRASQYGFSNALRNMGVSRTDRVVILVDQFEELFRFRRDEVTRIRAGIIDEAALCERRNDANAFVNMLLKSSQQNEQFVLVILTMRSDFLGDCDAFIGLPEAISRSQYLTPRLTRAQLEDAIRCPLALPNFQATISDDLVTRILNDVGTAPDQLPLMQHALMRTWQQVNAGNSTQEDSHPSSIGIASPRKLDLADYKAVGSVSGSLDQHAEEIFLGLGDETTRSRLQRVAERLFRSLSERRDDGPLTRRTIHLAEAVRETNSTEADVIAVASAFEAANLLVFSPPGQLLGPNTRIDISHESLLRQWKRFHTWFAAETASASQYCRVVESALLYYADRDELLTGRALDAASRWWDKEQPTEQWAERYAANAFERAETFLKLSREAERERHDAEERLRREREDAQERELAITKELAAAQQARALEQEAKATTFRWMLCAVGGVAVLAIGLFAWSLKLKHEAETNSVRANKQKEIAEMATKDAETQTEIAVRASESAEKQKNIANAQRLAAQASLSVDVSPQQRLLWAAEAFRATQPPEPASVNALYSLHREVGGRSLAGVPQESASAVAISPDLRWAAARFADGNARLWDLSLPEADPQVLMHSDNLVKVKIGWPSDGAVAFSPDSTLLMVAHGYVGNIGFVDDTTVQIWSLDSGNMSVKPKFVLGGHPGAVTGLAVLYDGRIVTACRRHPEVRIWDLNTPNGTPTSKILGSQPGSSALAVSPDGRSVAIASYDNIVRIWRFDSIGSFPEPFELKGHTQEIKALAFSPDGNWIASAGGDHFDDKAPSDYTIRLWSLNTEEKRKEIVFEGHGSDVNSIAWTPDSKVLVSGSEDKTVRIWSIGGGNNKKFQLSDTVADLKITHDGKWLVAASGNTCFRWPLFENTDAEPPLRMRGHDYPVWKLAMGNDGKTLLSAGSDIHLWDVGMPLNQPTSRHKEGIDIDFVRVVGDDSWIVLEGNMPSSSGGLSKDRTARLWKIGEPATEIKSLTLFEKQQLHNFKQGHNTAVSNDGRWLFANSKDSQGQDKSVLWNPAGKGPVSHVLAVDHPYTTASFNDAGTAVISGNRLFELTNELDVNSSQAKFDMGEIEDLIASDAEFIPHSKMAKMGTSFDIDSLRILWDVTNLQRPRRIDLPLLKGDVIDEGYRYSLLSPDSRWLLTIDQKAYVRIHDLSDTNHQIPSQVVGTFTGSDPSKKSKLVSFSDDSRWVVFTSGLHSIRALRLDAEKVVFESFDFVTADNKEWVHNVTERARREIDQCFFSESNRYIVSVDHYGLYLWELNALTESTTPKHFPATGERGMSDYFLAPDHRWVLGVGSGKAHLWDLSEKLKTPRSFSLRGHTEEEITLSVFSSNGRWLATGGGAQLWNDQTMPATVRVWDLNSENPARAGLLLGEHPSSVSAIAFDRAGERLVSASVDGTLMVWDLSADRLLTLASQTSGRNFTWDEWQSLFPDREYQRTFENLPMHPTAAEHYANIQLQAASEAVKLKDLESAKKAYSEATKWAIQGADSGLCNRICWQGCLDGFAHSVLAAGELATKLSPGNKQFTDARGVARALTGDPTGAISDFQLFVSDSSQESESIQLRNGWIQSLQRGEQPITDDVRLKLKIGKQIE